MIDDCYQLALAAIQHHLDEAGAKYELDEGEILVGGHRLGLAITFEGFVRQAEQTIAPLDIQIHLDGDAGDRFRMGTLGVGEDADHALRAAVAEWHLLAVAPLLAALGAAIDLRKTRLPQQLAGWDFFPGRFGVRGKMPAELDPSAPFYRSLLESLRTVVGSWEKPARFQLRSICLLASGTTEGREVQAAIDGLLDEPLTEQLSALPWPQGPDAYLYKQLFVLRSQTEQ
jgi:hypothetical protein